MGTLDKVEETVKHDLSWLQRHERLVLVVFALAVVLWLGNKWIDHAATDAERKAAVAEQVLAETKAANQKLAEQLQAQSAEFRQEQAVREQEIQNLLLSIASRDAASARKVKDVTAPKSSEQVVADLTEVYKGQTVTPLAVTPEGIQFAPPVVQQFTVTKIERDTFATDLKDQKDVANKRQEELNKANDLLGTNTQMITGLNKQLVDKDTQCKAEVSLEKAKGRKSKRNWFLGGLATGAGLVIKFGLL